LASHGVGGGLSATDQAYRAGLTDYFTGKYHEAAAKFDQVLALEPDHAQAQDFKRLAILNFPNEVQSGSGSNTTLLVGIAAGVVVLLAGVCAVLLVLRRRRARGRMTSGPTATGGAPQAIAPWPTPAPPGGNGSPVPQVVPVRTPPAEAVSNDVPGGPSSSAALQDPIGDFCPNCGERHQHEAKFCARCGERLPAGYLAERYELFDHLGSGGMASVWRGRDRRLNREIAVKILGEHLASDAGFRARFEREAMHVASLHHPNVVTVYDSGTQGDTYYIVMELVEGDSLQSRLDATSAYLPLEQAVRLGAEALAGLAHAHSRRIIHRDIKPANILLTEDDSAKLADFGIARGTDDSGHLTSTGSFLGTPLYAAPEQLKRLAATPATDQYSLACVLYQCLTGRPPFEGDLAAAVMAQHLEAAPRPPREYRPEIPTAVEATILTAMEKDPRRRFASAAEMRESLVGDAPAPRRNLEAAASTIMNGRAPLPGSGMAPTPGVR
jgi:serine/threonine-protein kinase